MRIFLVLVILMMGAPQTLASPFSHDYAVQQLAASEVMPRAPKNILPQRQRPAISNQQATARVRAAYSRHKILTVRLIESKGPPVYRVKTLSENGVVQYVFVDGTTGDLFD
jgi:uncharacterized protein YpmB